MALWGSGVRIPSAPPSQIPRQTRIKLLFRFIQGGRARRTARKQRLYPMVDETVQSAQLFDEQLGPSSSVSVNSLKPLTVRTSYFISWRNSRMVCTNHAG